MHQDRLGLEGLLLPALATLSGERVELQPELHSLLRNHLVWLLHCQNSLREVSLQAAARGIEVVVMKGCALSFSAYPRPNTRAYSDIDLCVQPHDLKQMRELLLGMGFTSDSYGIVYVRNDVPIDLHDHPLGKQQSVFGPFLDEWWSEIVPLPTELGAASCLSARLQFALGLVHGAKHAYCKAFQILDLMAICTKEDPMVLADVVSRYNLGKHLWLASEAAGDWFDYEFALPLRNAIVRPKWWQVWDHALLDVVKRRQETDWLGVMTPLWAAPDFVTGWKYFLRAFIPVGTNPFFRALLMLKRLLVVLKNRIRPAVTAKPDGLTTPAVH